MRFIVAIALFASGAQASDLVGPASCRTCHAEAYRIWSESPHARAAQALSPDQRKTPLCLQCHSRDEQRGGQASIEGVSCETCHGGGRYYQPGAQPSMKPFDVREAMQKIDHWTADRAARNQRAARTVPGPVSGRLAAWLRTAP